MFASNLSTDEMRKEARRLYTNLRKRMIRIEQKFLTAQYAYDKFKDLEKEYRKNGSIPFSKLTEQQVRDIYRDLTYISGLKSSTVKGAMEVHENFDMTMETLSELPDEYEDKFWETYDKLYNATYGLIDKIKYDVMVSIVDGLYSGRDVEDIVSDIHDTFIDEYEKSGGRILNDESLSFTERLFCLFK